MPRLALSLSVYEHAAAFVGLTPGQVFRDGELIERAHRAAYEAYQHFPLVVGIDIYNLEAEAYGAEISTPAGTGIPAVTRPVLSLADAAALRPFDPATAGRVPLMIGVGRRLQEAFPEADVRLPVSGPFSIAQSLVGLETLVMGAALEPGAVRDFLEALVPGQLRYCEAVLAAGLKVAFFESAAAPPLLSPAQFRAIELPVLGRLIGEVAALAGVPVPCIIGGDTAAIVGDLLETGTDFLICPAETDRARFLAALEGYPEVRVRINLDPHVYTRGSREQMARAVEEVIALAAQRPNLLLGTGAIPWETPPENILALSELCE